MAQTNIFRGQGRPKAPQERKMRYKNSRGTEIRTLGEGTKFTFLFQLQGKYNDVYVFMSIRLSNSPKSMFNSKKISAGDTPELPLKKGEA